MPPPPTVTELAATIATHAAELRDPTASGSSFNFGVSPDTPGTGLGVAGKAHEATRASLLGAARQLTALLQTPAENVRDLGARISDAMALQFIADFGVAERVPLDGEATLGDLAASCRVEETDFTRLLRFAMTNGFFREPRPGVLVHTPASRALVEDVMLRDNVAIMVDEMFPAASMVARALQKHPLSQDPVHSGWNLANATDKPFFTTLADKHPSRLEALVRGMHTSASTINARILAQNLDWSSMPASPLIVDVGGGPGVVSIALAREHPGLRCIVQDMPYAVASGTASLPHELVDRISFTPHDVFAEQSVHGADMYLLRAVFRNWPDAECVQIARALIPALKQGARIVISDPVMIEGGTTLPVEYERAVRGFDLSMMTFFHGKDRTPTETAQLFAKADPRFCVLGTRIPTVNTGDIPRPALLGITEVVWDAA